MLKTASTLPKVDMEMFLSRIYVSRPLLVCFANTRRARIANYPLFYCARNRSGKQQSGDFLTILTDPPPDARECNNPSRVWRQVKQTHPSIPRMPTHAPN